jgi:hypothetical protein
MELADKKSIKIFEGVLKVLFIPACNAPAFSQMKNSSSTAGKPCRFLSFLELHAFGLNPFRTGRADFWPSPRW